MTTIDPGQRLPAALGTPLAGVRERATSRAAAGTGAQAGRRSPRTVSAAMAQRIAAIAPDDPDRPRKAVRIYLEAELAREFGAGLLADPSVPNLLDAVQQRMDEDAQTAQAVLALGRLLLAGKLKPA